MPKKIETHIPAPDFELTDTQSRLVKLSDLWSEKYVVLVLLRGFV
jgi:hypothetical protein